MMKEDSNYFALISLIPGRQEGELRRYSYDEQVIMKVGLNDLLAFCHHVHGRLNRFDDKFKLISGGKNAKFGEKLLKSFSFVELAEPEKSMGFQMKVVGGKSFFVPMTISEIKSLIQIVEKMIMKTLDSAFDNFEEQYSRRTNTSGQTALNHF
ncbi:MAG: hypothetical protein QW835_00015 [Candidatus Hadarchaeum sp.]